MRKYNNTHGNPKVLFKFFQIAFTLVPPFFFLPPQGLPRLHLALFTPFKCRVELSMAGEANKSREKVSGGEVAGNAEADPPSSPFPRCPLYPPTHCNWGENKKETLLYSSRAHLRTWFQQYHKFKLFNHLWFSKHPFWWVSKSKLTLPT